MRFNFKKNLKQVAKCFGILTMTGLVVVGIANAVVVQGAQKWIIKVEDPMPSVEAVVIPGALVWEDGRPCGMLQDRLDTGLELYQKNPHLKIIVSGDHGRKDYDEVNAMRAYLEDRGVPTEHIYMDHAGFNTYETMYRARDIFKAQSVIVVTQDYHLKRAVYIGNHIGIETYGVSSDKHVYGKMMVFKLREYLARTKDLFNADVLKPAPTYLGAAIPIQMVDGTLTHDKE